MSKWANSRELTRASYSLVKENPGMNRWTVRAAVHGALVGGAGLIIGMVVFALGAVMLDSDSGSAAGILGWVVLALGLVVMFFGGVAGLTAANLQLAGLVQATDDVLHGREPNQEKARQAAHSRFGTLAKWSTISVVVGMLVSMIRGDGDSGFIVGIVRTLLAGMVAVVWAVVTTLVMPVIVLEDEDAVAAIKRSAALIRSTWGESVFGTVRIGARFALIFTLPGLVLLVGGIVVGLALGGPAAIAGAVLAVVGLGLMIVGAVKAATCRNVFGVALYRWTTGEGALGPFSEDELRGAVQVRGESAGAFRTP